MEATLKSNPGEAHAGMHTHTHVRTLLETFTHTNTHASTLFAHTRTLAHSGHAQVQHRERTRTHTATAQKGTKGHTASTAGATHGGGMCVWKCKSMCRAAGSKCGSQEHGANAGGVGSPTFVCGPQYPPPDFYDCTGALVYQGSQLSSKAKISRLRVARTRRLQGRTFWRFTCSTPFFMSRLSMAAGNSSWPCSSANDSSRSTLRGWRSV